MSKISVNGKGSSKEIIASKAAMLFRSRGYNSCTMRQLAESMDIEAPSLYNHIGSKAELLVNICFSVADEFNRHIEELELLKLPGIEKIENLIRFHIRIMIRRHNEVYVSNHEWKQLPDPYLAQFLQQRRVYENKMVQIIRTAIRKKEIQPIEPYIAVLTILSAVRGVETWQRHKKGITPGKLEDDMTQHLLNGLINSHGH
ncbi:MAG TPA: TetR/AcrR family transcriptional regulator [Ferruginibacter sp.]|nr:TetR/AcrR family transcriptional regulator [Ferruginibacter sp.]HRO06214.1 TetR/AcrR family transcriptional regulator [Ferruginibacter sp.]HRO97387.1 TetR/AcrR family transcriptional regulator [Ferruginibacter sp.]HRP49673.1 TetR/AcrR family transcriptional regulator [Ferruginibacter sp.]